MSFAALPQSMKMVAAAATAFMLVACGASTEYAAAPASTASAAAFDAAKFEADRQAILAMTGDYKVTFDFTETVAFQEGYELKNPYITGGYEVVRVIEDTGRFISLQHILVVGDGEKMPLMPVKHWRQDWVFEPAFIMDFAGANTWRKREIPADERAGAWAQVVYQVDDAPRYAATARWIHENGVSSWTSPPSWRPLPRRDATKRDDYHVMVAANRHAITPEGWVHEQDNAKLVLTGDTPSTIVHEIGVNTYRHSDDFQISIATDYWEKTQAFWDEIRAEWDALIAANDELALTVLGEPEEIYMPILAIASDVDEGTKSAPEAAKEAIELLREYITNKPGAPRTRLAAAAAKEAGGGY